MKINKKTIITIVVAALLVVGIYWFFFRDKKTDFTIIEAVQGSIAQEIFESGQIRRGEKINLSFKNNGRIEEIYAEVGDEVRQGQRLAKLDTVNLELQLEEARFSLILAQLGLKKILDGASPEEIRIAENQAEAAKVALETAKENLNSAYNSAITVLNSSYISIYDTLDSVKSFISRSINVYDDGARKIRQARDAIYTVRQEARFYLEGLDKNLNNNQGIETALSAIKSSLEKTFDNLEIIRNVIDDFVIYQNIISAAEKDDLDALKTNINTALSNVISAQKTISSTKLGVETAKINLQEALNRLDLTRAEARQTDIELQETKIKQAQAQARIYENQIEQSELVSPIDGKIVEIKKRAGELAQATPQDAVMVILPFAAYEIKADIYEEDVVKINIGNPVEISFTAFPERIFKGRVISIEPAERIIDGVVYYQTIIGFEENIENLRPGMTADIVIQTDLKENVLIIHRDAIQRKNGKTIAEVLKNGAIEQREIEIGIRGSDNMVEIISGLEEGEKIIQR